MTSPEIKTARARFVGWIRWYLETYEDVSQAALARRIGVSPSALNQWLAPGSTRCPSFEALVGFKILTGFGLDMLVGQDPPNPRSVTRRNKR